MPDKRTHHLLMHINALCADGSYKIVEKSELLSCFPVKLGTDEKGLENMLRYLKEHHYIDVKYAQDGVYCLSPLPEGRMYEEQVRQGREEGLRRRVSILLFTALGAFLGAFLGALSAMALVGAA